MENEQDNSNEENRTKGQPLENPLPESEIAQRVDSAIPSRTPDNPKKPIIIGKRNIFSKPIAIGMFAAVLVLVGIGSIFLMNNNEGPAPVVQQQTDPVVQEKVTTLGASIASIEGDVEYSQDGTTWTEASGGESLAHLDYVRTLNESRAIILFDDGSVARLDSNTELYLSSLEIDTIEVTLMEGQVYSRVVESESRVFTVVTANERFEALGTAYKTSTDGTLDELEVYQSTVKVASGDLDVSEGNKYDTESKVLGAIDLESLSEDEFAQWNKEQDSSSNEFKDKLGVLKEQVKVEEETDVPTASSSTPAGIVLSGTKASAGVQLSWTLNGLSSSQGFKIVRSTSDSTPTYGENEAIYVGESAARTNTWYSDNGKTHYYRICVYSAGTCSNYSNAIQVTSPLVEKALVVSGGITLSISGKTLNWSLSGGTAPHGFKVVLSESTGPTYPANSIQYVGAEKSSAALPEKAPGTYYVKVCKYTNGTQDAGCVDYSNEVQYIVTGS